MTTKRFIAFLAFFCFTFLSVQATAEEALVLKRPVLTLDAATKIAHASIDACRKKGINVTVTVIGRNGQVMTVMRDTLAMEVTLDLSKLKAVTALSMNSVTSSLAGRYKNPGALEKYDGLLFMPGGAPVNAGGSILGAVGVSGSPNSMDDEICALAGIKSVSTDLEMAM